MLSAFLRSFSAFLLCGKLEYLTKGRRNARLRLALFHRAVYRDIGTVDSAMEQGEAQPRIAPPLSEVFELPA